jgi:hypothetical protein
MTQGIEELLVAGASIDSHLHHAEIFGRETFIATQVERFMDCYSTLAC